MSRKEILVCDICGCAKDENYISNFCKKSYFWQKPENFDICDDCLKEIRKTIRKRNEDV